VVDHDRRLENDRQLEKYSDADLIRLMTLAGQRKASNDDSFRRALTGDSEPAPLFLTKDDARDLIHRELVELFGRLQMPVDTNESFAKTLLKLNRLFERDEGLSRFGGRLIWAIAAGITTMLLTALALKFGLPVPVPH
jgi:hypothetical protein